MRDAWRRVETVRLASSKRAHDRIALYGALHELHCHYVASVGGAPTAETAPSGEASAEPWRYESFGDLCVKEIGIDKHTVYRSIKQTLIARLFCEASMLADEVDRTAASKVASSSYRCLVAPVSEWSAPDDWIDWPLARLMTWLAAREQEGLRDLLVSVWRRAKGKVGGKGNRRLMRRHFEEAYADECAAIAAAAATSRSPTPCRRAVRHSTSRPGAACGSHGIEPIRNDDAGSASHDDPLSPSPRPPSDPNAHDDGDGAKCMPRKRKRLDTADRRGGRRATSRGGNGHNTQDGNGDDDDEQAETESEHAPVKRRARTAIDGRFSHRETSALQERSDAPTAERAPSPPRPTEGVYSTERALTAAAAAAAAAAIPLGPNARPTSEAFACVSTALMAQPQPRQAPPLSPATTTMMTGSEPNGAHDRQGSDA